MTMEKFMKIPTSDWFEISGILNWQESSDKLIIFVHGFTWNMWEAHYYCAKEYFTEKWYDVFRFNLYTDGDKTRKLNTCTVKTHSEDIKTACVYFTDYKEIFLIGHSLAWPCLWWVDKYPMNVERVVFWDPAFDMKITWNKCYEDQEHLMYESSWKHIEISREMQREFLEDNFLDILENQDFSKDKVFGIYADWDRHVQNKPATDAMWIESCIIEWVNHWFTQEWKYKELFDKTLEYIEK